MAGVEVRNFDAPEETRTPDKTTLATLKVGGALVVRAVMEPGWRWSDCIKPLVGTESCQVHHLGIVLSGRGRVRRQDGRDVRPGLRRGDVREGPISSCGSAPPSV